MGSILDKFKKMWNPPEDEYEYYEDDYEEGEEDGYEEEPAAAPEEYEEEPSDEADYPESGSVLTAVPPPVPARPSSAAARWSTLRLPS